MENMIVNLQDIDITDTPLFEGYADFKSELNFENEHRPFIRTYLPPEVKSQNEALKSAFNNLSPAELKSKADALIKAQDLNRSQELIDHMASKQSGNYNQFSSMWSPVMWQARENRTSSKVKIGDKIVDTFDVDFLIAENLQQLYSQENPRAEYYDWVERQQQIEIAINTGGTTEEEIAERNTFISFLDDRETEIKRIITLYSGAALNPNCRQQTEAQEKLKFLTFKLSELRRLRERTQSTQSQADTHEYFAEKERRERQAAVTVTAGITSATIASEMMSLGEQRILKGCNASHLEHGIGESFIHLRPDTLTKEQALAKIDTAKLNHEQMMAMLTAMRNGMSKEEWLKTQQAQTTSSTAEKVRRLRGFSVNEFKHYSNSL